MTVTEQELLAWASAEAAKHVPGFPAGSEVAVRLLLIGYAYGLEKACEHVRFKSDRKRIDNLMVDAQEALDDGL